MNLDHQSFCIHQKDCDIDPKEIGVRHNMMGYKFALKMNFGKKARFRVDFWKNNYGDASNLKAREELEDITNSHRPLWSEGFLTPQKAHLCSQRKRLSAQTWFVSMKCTKPNSKHRIAFLKLKFTVSFFSLPCKRLENAQKALKIKLL